MRAARFGAQFASGWAARCEFRTSVIGQARTISGDGIRIITRVGKFLLKDALPASIVGAGAAGAAPRAAGSLVGAYRVWVGDRHSPPAVVARPVSHACPHSPARFRRGPIHG